MAKVSVAALQDSFLIWEQLPQDDGGKEMPNCGRSEEELKSFTVDERLSEVERTVLYLNGGQLIQQRHAIRNLPVVIRGRGRAAWDAINPALKSALNKLDAEAQIEAAEAFATLARDRLMGSLDLQACLLPTICRNINKERSDEEIEAWLQALFVLIPLLDKEVLRSEVASLALSKGDVDESVNSRVICARILGAVSTWMTRDEVERSFFKKAMSMCQDVHYYTRAAMCQQLVLIGKAVGPELVSGQLLDELLELLKDEEVKVRVAAFSTLVSLLELLPVDVRKSRVMPVLRNHMQPFDLEPAMQTCVCQHFGKLLTLIKSDMETADQPLFYGCFRHLAARGDLELRQACASQLGTAVRAACSLNPGAYHSHFHDTLTLLSGDASEDVRAVVAEQLHECAKMAGKEAGSLLTRPLVRLLRDESPRVQAAALKKLGSTLVSLVCNTPDEAKRESMMSDVVKALVELEAATQGRRWRMQVALAQSFSSFPHAFSSDQIYDHFIPMAFRLLTSAAVAVRPAAAEGLTHLLRHCRKERQRSETFLRLIRELARAKSFSCRMAFGNVAEHLLACFSSRFIKEWVFDLCLELVYDVVPNVRLQFVPLLPAMKQVIRLPEDVDLLERLNNAMSHVMTDNDRDVSVSGRAVNDAFKRLPVRMGLGTQVVEVNGVMGGGFEAMDRKREEEEAELPGFTPEDAKEIKAELMQNGVRRRGGAASMSGVDPRMPRKSSTGQAPGGGILSNPVAGRLSMGPSPTPGASGASAARGMRMPSPSPAQRAAAAGSSAAAASWGGARAGAAPVGAPGRPGVATSVGMKPGVGSTGAGAGAAGKLLPSKPGSVSASGVSGKPPAAASAASGSLRSPSPAPLRPGAASSAVGARAGLGSARTSLVAPTAAGLARKR